MNKKNKTIFGVTVLTTIMVIGGVDLLSLNNQNNDLNSQINQFKSKNGTLLKEIDELNTKNEQSTYENNEIKEKIKELEERLEDYKFKSINFDINNVTLTSNLKIKQLEILFRNDSTYNNLVGLEQAFIDAEKEYGINAMFILGIVSQESGFVSSRRAIENNNLTGYAIYHNGSEKAFNSKYDCIMTTTKLLKDEYVIGRNLKSIRGINEVYCPNDNYKWSNSIKQITSTYIKQLNKIKDIYNS